jgi:hypothetical protein
MISARFALCLSVFVAACRVATDATPPDGASTRGSKPSEWREAGLHWAAWEENVAAALPAGLSYCPLPEDRNGIDRAQTFYLVPPSQCDWRSEWPIPYINIYAASSILALVQLERETLSALDLARAQCKRAEKFSDIVILGRTAVGCRTDHGDTSTVEVFAVADARPRESEYPPTITLTLKTTRSRLATDWAVLRSVAAGIYICEHPATKQPLMVTCPGDGPW